MRPQQLTITGVGATAPYPLDVKANVFNVGLTYVVTGTSTFNVEVCGEDILGGQTPNWLPVTGLTGLTASGIGQITIPVSGIRLNATAGTGTIVLNINQPSGL